MVGATFSEPPDGYRAFKRTFPTVCWIWAASARLNGLPRRLYALRGFSWRAASPFRVSNPPAASGEEGKPHAILTVA